MSHVVPAKLGLTLCIAIFLSFTVYSAAKEMQDTKLSLKTAKNNAMAAVKKVNERSPTPPVSPRQQNREQINWQVFSDGGGWSTTTGLQLFSVIGQTAAGESGAGALRLQHGFLQSFGSQSCCAGVTGNIDCDPSSVVDIADLTTLIDHLFISLDPLCCPFEGNVDGDEQGVVDIADLTFLIDHLFISLIPTAACQ